MKKLFLFLGIVFSISLFTGTTLADGRRDEVTIVIEGDEYSYPKEITADVLKIGIKSNCVVNIRSVQANTLLLDAKEGAMVTVDNIKAQSVTVRTRDNATVRLKEVGAGTAMYILRNNSVVKTRNVTAGYSVDINLHDSATARYEKVVAGGPVTADMVDKSHFQYGMIHADKVSIMSKDAAKVTIGIACPWWKKVWYSAKAKVFGGSEEDIYRDPITITGTKEVVKE